jgi:hypothetical protein
MTRAWMALAALVISVPATLAQVGETYPKDAEVSDQKTGSVLIYNIYTSSATSANAQNTRINLTNANPYKDQDAYVHLFFVDGSTCTPADAYICLTANQTTSFLVSDIDPGVTGYLVAVAVDGTTGCPINFNWLMGDEYVKFASGHTANLGAEAIAAVAETPSSSCTTATFLAELSFDGVNYNLLPRVLAIDNIPSRADGNDTMIIINRIGGDLLIGASRIGSIFGLAYDDAEKPVSFTFSSGACQFRNVLSNNFPRLVPRFETFISAGRSGWMKFYSLEPNALLGAVINFNGAASANASAFNGGHNLHKLALTSASMTISVFPPGC